MELTVVFDDPFWVGVFTRQEGGGLTAARTVFGAEPKDYEVYEYFLANWYSLRFSPSRCPLPIHGLTSMHI